jgi:Protein of unknown function (DUF4058)
MMPLLDHFTAPVPFRQRWESFHSYWAARIGTQLNESLPKRFFTAVQQHHGSRIEADVLEYDGGPDPDGNGSGGGLAVQTYAPPKVTGVFPATFPDEVEITIVDVEDSEKLVGVIELVSPANKHDPKSRGTFAGKCAAYLANGIGLLIVDPVLTKHFNLHDEIINLLQHPADFRMPQGTHSYAAAYRPVRREETNQIDFWTSALSVGDILPTLPLALKGWGCIPIDLEDSYMQVCETTGLVH